MNIIDAIKEALIQKNNEYPISILHRHRKDSFGYFTLYVIFTSKTSYPTWLRVEEDDEMILNGDKFCPSVADYIIEDWEPSNKFPYTQKCKGKPDKVMYE